MIKKEELEKAYEIVNKKTKKYAKHTVINPPNSRSTT